MGNFSMCLFAREKLSDQSCNKKATRWVAFYNFNLDMSGNYSAKQVICQII